MKFRTFLKPSVALFFASGVLSVQAQSYYEQRTITFDRADGEYTVQMLREDFGNGSFFSGDRQNAAIIDSTYRIKFPKGKKVGGTGAAAVAGIPEHKQYTLEYMIKYPDDFETGLHGKQFGFRLGAGYSGGSSLSCRTKGDGGTVRIQFDAFAEHISNQLYVYYSDMTAETYGENPGGQKFSMKRGVWNRIRLSVTLESCYEERDARIEVWCNGEKKIDVTDLSLVREDSSRNITGICFESFPGGGGDYPSYDNYLYLDDLSWYRRGADAVQTTK